MHADLAAIYGTPGGEAAQQEDLEKAAEAELFAKLATEAGIDLNELDDGQIQELYQKVAEHKCPKCDKSDDECTCDDKEESKESQAHAEFAVQQDWNEKVAEADYLGRVMAHSMAAEQGDIEKQAYKGQELVGKGVEAVKAFGAKVRSKAERGGELMTGSKGKRLRAQSATYAGGAERAGAMKSPGAASLAKKLGDKATKKGRGAGAEEAAVSRARKIVGGGAAAAGLGGTAYAMNKENAANSSAMDQLAAEEAIEKAAAEGWDVDEAVELISAVLTLGGPGESDKIASAESLEEATDLRSLEYLEAAGYPVNW